MQEKQGECGQAGDKADTSRGERMWCWGQCDRVERRAQCGRGEGCVTPRADARPPVFGRRVRGGERQGEVGGIPSALGEVVGGGQRGAGGRLEG